MKVSRTWKVHSIISFLSSSVEEINGESLTPCLHPQCCSIACLLCSQELSVSPQGFKIAFLISFSFSRCLKQLKAKFKKVILFSSRLSLITIQARGGLQTSDEFY